MEAKAALGQAKASMWVVFGAFMICLLVLALVLDNFRTAISEGWGRSIFHFVIVLNLVALLIFRHIVRFRL
ncbi:MAG: hypothetical protein NZO16_02930 [Deltaproteobacteria bacterium]|nr:hypothetical protein [Deltaproteobacteria bacterium]